MKVLFVLLTLGLSSQAKSKEAAGISPQVKKGSNVYDLMYFPQKGTFSGISTYKFTNLNQTLDYQSQEFANTKTKTSTLGQSLGFTYDSKTIFGTSFSYQIDSSTTTTYGPGSNYNGQSHKNLSEQGFEEPNIFLKQRIKSQEEDNFNIDATLKFSPKIGNATSSTLNKKGNALRGASEIVLEAEIGKKSDTSSWKATLLYSRTFEAKNEDAEIAADLTISDPYNLFGLSFSHQWSISSDFEINLNAGIVFLSEMNSLNQYSHLINGIDSSSLLNFGPVFILNLSPKSTIEMGVLVLNAAEKSFKQTNTLTGTSVSLIYKIATSEIISLTSKYEF